MSEESGIKEVAELLDGLEVISGIVGHVLADGKVGASDLPKLMPLIAEFEKLEKAFTGLSGAKKELTKLDQAEVLQIVSKVYAVADAFNAGKKKA